MSKKRIIIAGLTTAAIAIGSGVALATIRDSERPITGDARDRAAEAALDHVGEGEVTDTEVGDEESYYEVEVTKDDGSQTDVQLDQDFKVVGSEVDEADENEGESEGTDD